MTWLWVAGLTVLGLLAAVAAVLVQIPGTDDTEWTPATGDRAFLAYHDDDDEDDD